MKLSTDKEQKKSREHGVNLARGIEDLKVEQEKNMAKAARRHQTMLERAAEKALSGGVQR